MDVRLASQRHAVEDAGEAIEFCYRTGWTDGLPVVPPTERRVIEFLANGGHEPDDIIGGVPDRARVFTAEKVAINAVMAGCLKEYFPIVLAAIEAGGSSLRDYARADGELGYFQHHFAVYDREDQPCPGRDCKGKIKRIVQSGRSTFYCPSCQR